MIHVSALSDDHWSDAWPTNLNDLKTPVSHLSYFTLSDLHHERQEFQVRRKVSVIFAPKRRDLGLILV